MKYKIILLGINSTKRKEIINEIRSTVPKLNELFDDNGVATKEFEWDSMVEDMSHLKNIPVSIVIYGGKGLCDRYFWKGVECDLPF